MATPRFLLTASGDLDLSQSLRVDTTIQSVVGKIRKTLFLFLGSWFLDGTQGVPWFQQILAVKNPDLRLVQNIIKSAIADIDDVVSVPEVALSFDSAKRTLTVTFAANTLTGLAQGAITVP